MGKEHIRYAKIFETWWTLGITGGTLRNTSKKITFHELSNIRAEVKTNLRTSVNTKEDTTIETTTARVLFLIHRPAEALKRINPLEIIKHPQKLLESPAKILLHSTL